jgi:hypothetical protein
MPYPWRSRSDSVRRINMSSEPGKELFFCALRPILRILSLQRRDYASQVQIGEPTRRKTLRISSGLVGILLDSRCPRENSKRLTPDSGVCAEGTATRVRMSCGVAESELFTEDTALVRVQTRLDVNNELKSRQGRQPTLPPDGRTVLNRPLRSRTLPSQNAASPTHLSRAPTSSRRFDHVASNDAAL